MAGRAWGSSKPKSLLVDEEKLRKAEAAKRLGDVDDIVLWAASAYVIDSNYIMFYRATHNVPEDMPDSTLSAKARTWVGSPLIKNTIQFAKESLLTSEVVSPTMRRFLMEKNEEEHASLVEKDEISLEDLNKLSDLLMKRIMNGEGDLKDAFSFLEKYKKFRGWTDDSNDEENSLFCKTIHYYLPYECDKCRRKAICPKCMIEREAYNELTAEEKEWIKKNDSSQ